MLDLSAINPLGLPSLPLSLRIQFPQLSGIYFCLSGSEEILYINKTKNLLQRWSQHHKAVDLIQYGIVRLSWLEVSYLFLLDEIENATIRHFQPSLNQLPYSSVSVTKGIRVRLRELRARKKISQNELAQRLEMSLANVHKIAYNKAKSIPLDTLDQRCEILECEVGELLVRIPTTELKG